MSGREPLFIDHEEERKRHDALMALFPSRKLEKPMTHPTPEERDPFDTHAKFHDAGYAKGFADALRLAAEFIDRHWKALTDREHTVACIRALQPPQAGWTKVTHIDGVPVRALAEGGEG